MGYECGLDGLEPRNMTLNIQDYKGQDPYLSSVVNDKLWLVYLD